VPFDLGKTKDENGLIKIGLMKKDDLPGDILTDYPFDFLLFYKGGKQIGGVKDGYLDEDMMKNYLCGRYDALSSTPSGEFFLDEIQIHNKRDPRTGRVDEENGGLFVYSMKRIQENVSFSVDFFLDSEIELDESGALKLGGEGRVSFFKKGSLKHILSWDEFKKAYDPNNDLLKMIFITPVIVDNEAGMLPKRLDKFDIKAVAIKGKGIASGWDIVKNYPKETYKTYLPGTVVWFDYNEELTKDEYDKLCAETFSDCRGNEGYGLILLGIEKNVK
jgi:CRISPR type III-B/RAMP module-associated protein Cmr3